MIKQRGVVVPIIKFKNQQSTYPYYNTFSVRYSVYCFRNRKSIAAHKIYSNSPYTLYAIRIF